MFFCFFRPTVFTHTRYIHWLTAFDWLILLQQVPADSVSIRIYSGIARFPCDSMAFLYTFIGALALRRPLLPIWVQRWNILCQTGLSSHLFFLTSGHSDARGWASECPVVKNYKWRLNPVWHRMLYSHTPYGNSGSQRAVTTEAVSSRKRRGRWRTRLGSNIAQNSASVRSCWRIQVDNGRQHFGP